MHMFYFLKAESTLGAASFLWLLSLPTEASPHFLEEEEEEYEVRLPPSPSIFQARAAPPQKMQQHLLEVGGWVYLPKSTDVPVRKRWVFGIDK